MDSMTAEQALEAAKGLTFEKVWAAMMESRKDWEETKKQMKESQDSLAQAMKESLDRMDKTVGELTKNVGGVNNSLGQLTEALFSAELWKKFDKQGYEFTGQTNDYKFIVNKKVVAEADFFLENGKYVMPVEVKTKLSIDNVDAHLKRIEVIRGYLDGKNDNRKIVGAVAGGVVKDDVLQYAQGKGLYVFVQTRDSITIADAPQDFVAREW